MQSPQTALGTSRLENDGKSPFEIAESQWQSIQDYTANIAAIDSQLLLSISQPVPTIFALYNDCQKWRVRTSSGIIGLAHDTSDYGTSVVPTAYGELEAALDQVDQNNNPQIKQRCNDTISSLQEHCRRMNDAATSLLSDIQDLVTNATLVAQQVDAAGGPDAVLSKAHYQTDGLWDNDKDIFGNPRVIPIGKGPVITEDMRDRMEKSRKQNLFRLGEELTKADDASIVGSLEKMEGGWAAITSDLGDLQQWISTQIDANQPFASELAIDAAISEWAAVANEATAFADAAK